MAPPVPPESVLIAFLHNCAQIGDGDIVRLVLRGSLLLRCWYGASARHAADLDLEFYQDSSEPEENADYLANYAHAACRFAADGLDRNRQQGIRFEETTAPPDGQSLWAYGTPGERFYLGWVWRENAVRSGLMQLDLSQAPYTLDEVSLADIHLVTESGASFQFRAYTPEMMIATKLSWLMRSLTRRGSAEAIQPPVWSGELKDLFDLHLLLTKGPHRPAEVQKSLLAIGLNDKLEWQNLEAIFDAQRTELNDRDFANWPAFHRVHAARITCGPAEMLREIAERLEPLLGDFYCREEMPMLAALNEGLVDESMYVIYADWLEERRDQRSEFLRLFTQLYFHSQTLSPQDLNLANQRLKAALEATSQPWLQQLFGTAARAREMRQRIEAGQF